MAGSDPASHSHDDHSNGSVTWIPTNFSAARSKRPGMARMLTSESMRDPKSSLTRKPTVSFGPENPRNSYYARPGLVRVPTTEAIPHEGDPQGCESRRPTVFNPEDLRNPQLRRPTLTFTPDQLKYLQTRRPTLVHMSSYDETRTEIRGGHSRKPTVTFVPEQTDDAEDDELKGSESRRPTVSDTEDFKGMLPHRSTLIFTPQQLKYLEARRPTLGRTSTSEDGEDIRGPAPSRPTMTRTWTAGSGKESKGSSSRKSSVFGPVHSRSLHSRRPTVISLARKTTSENLEDFASCKTRRPTTFPEKAAESESRRPTIWSLHQDDKTDPESWASTVDSLGLEKSSGIESRRQTVAELKGLRHSETRKRKLWCVWLSVVLCFLILAAAVIPPVFVFTRPKATPGPVADSTILMPLYVYPHENAWEPLIEVANMYKNLTFLAIINPANGPGSGNLPDNAYISSVQALNKVSNVNVIGYVRTAMATRNISDVLADVAKYEGWATNPSVTSSRQSLAVDGIFFDEAPTEYTVATAEYLMEINAYVKNSTNIKGDKTVIHNPGTIPDNRLRVASTDIQVVVEDTYASFSARATQKTLDDLPGSRSGYSYMVHSTPDSVNMHELVDTISQKAKYIFVTDLSKDYYTSFGTRWMEFVFHMVN